MPEQTYRTGYGTTRRTLAELNLWNRWYNLDPEFRRRYLRMMNEAKLAGVDLGVGGGWRSSAEQEALFRSRYTPYLTPKKGATYWKGRWWVKKPGVAAAAPPGRSYHEETTPAGFALAIDAVGWENGWMEKNCHRFGLRTAIDVNNEPWHVFPVELPPSRSNYSPSRDVLVQWKFTPLKPYGDWPTAIKPTIQIGSTGPVVEYAQKVLVDKAGQIITVDSKFGPQTNAAVKNLQAFCKMTVSGIIDKDVWAVIDTLAKQES